MMRAFLFGAALFAAATPAVAQDNSNIVGEVVVTGQRASADYLSDEQTVVGLRRTADSAIQPVKFTSDSRDEDMRKQEIHAMLEAAIRRADAAGVELATGDFELAKVTLANYKDLAFARGARPDTSEIGLFVKASLAGSVGGAQGRIDSFIKSVPATGRALIEKRGGITLTIINPDQYREPIVKLVAAEALKTAAAFGPDYGVEVAGLNEQLIWAQASATEVFLYIPYRFSVRPK
ncbi:TonB-dependent receptor [Sphingopyxis sp. GW247-27LB]|uniref:TonB-dependent receptor n=1 Tax=Sphingopyxis sp. GW247-27LB TaxID=2012632 RepID=UPI000BA77934|nr:TonB-dependent receptor [Sphingopyxis sp. GW247-27LB]PAL25033.1 TonB-dependent receptor [Sphingopyxis sp. GW247-27LB]